MGVDSQVYQYTAWAGIWQKCRDCVTGEEAVKARGEVYLPRLSGQSAADYEAYKARALFYGASGRTVDAMTGALTRRPLSVSYPDFYDSLPFTSHGQPLSAVAVCCAEELITTGRVCALVDMAQEPSDDVGAYVVLYNAEDVINWRVEWVGARPRLTLVVIRESVEEPADSFSTSLVQQLRVLRLVDGQYVTELWRSRKDSTRKSTWELVEQITPTRLGEPLDFIPFIFITPRGVTPEIVRPPILDLVNVNLSHYRSSADLEHGRHFTALPTAWVAGFDPDTELRIGSSVAWVASDPSARAGFLEFTGQGLRALETALEQKERLMAVLGTRLLDVPRPQVEAAETHRLRQFGETSVLVRLSSALSDGLTTLARWKALWDGVAPESAIPEISVSLSRDFDVARLSAQDMTALVQAYQSGAISLETLLYNLRKGEILPPGVDEETEIARIQNGLSVLAG